MEQERVLIECKPATIQQMKNDPEFLVQYVEEYLKNNSGVIDTQPKTPSPSHRNDSIKHMLSEIRQIKRKLSKLKLKQVQFVDEDKRQDLDKIILKVIKRIENLTEEMNAVADHQKELVVLIYEESERVRKLRDWQNGSK